MRSRDYNLVNADLRDIAMVNRKLAAAGLDKSQPTLFLSECVMVYMEPEDSGALIAWAAAEFRTATFVTYEQIHPHDSFGRMMLAHLEVQSLVVDGVSRRVPTATIALIIASVHVCVPVVPWLSTARPALLP